MQNKKMKAPIKLFISAVVNCSRVYRLQNVTCKTPLVIHNILQHVAYLNAVLHDTEVVDMQQTQSAPLDFVHIE